MSDQPHVAAVVVNWNGGDQIAACLDALLAQEGVQLDVVVVDNDSHDDSRQVMAPYVAAGRVRVVENATNRGFAGGANDGLATVDTPFVLVSNFDVRPAPDYLARALTAFGVGDRIGAVQGKLIRFTQAPDGGDVIDTTGHVAFTTRLFRNRGEGEVDRGQWDEPGEVFGISGALALYRRAMLDDLAIVRDGGGREIFDEDLFAFFEDVDLDWRAQRRGWQVMYEPTAVARHERGGAGVRRTPKVERLNFTNRLLVIARNDDGASLLRALPAVSITTALKFLEMLLTVPSAVPGAVADFARKFRRVRSTRAQLSADATITPAEIAARWFEPFDYVGWIRTWWRRIRDIPPGS